ncbi:major facilitator superfamily domain-containing protein, partial [Blakeslea trispora]
MLKRTNPRTWLSFIMLAWGIVTLCMAFAKDFQGLLICRLLLGAAESGYIPGILYVMSQAYHPRKIGLRIAMLLSMNTLSGVVSGPIAYGTAFLEGHKGLHGWQYLFILESVPTICLSVVSYFCLIESIDKTTWLTPAQKAVHREYIRMQKEDHQAKTTLKTIVEAIADWKTGLFSIVFFFNVISAVSCQVFLPTIISGFGFPVLTTQLLTAPPNLAGTIAVILGGLISDRYHNKRGIIITIGFLISGFGYMSLLFVQGRWAPSNLGWSAVNFPRLEIRAIAVAVVV